MEPLLRPKAMGSARLQLLARPAVMLMCVSALAIFCALSVRRQTALEEVAVPGGAVGSQLGFISGRSHNAPYTPGKEARIHKTDVPYDPKMYQGFMPKAVVWGAQDGAQDVSDGHPLDAPDRFHTGFRWARPLDVRNYAFDPSENGVRRDRQGFYMDWEQGLDLDASTQTPGFDDMDKAPTTQLEEAEADESGAAEGRSQPYDFDPYPYAVETAQHAVGEQNYGREGSRPDDDPVKSAEPWPFARAPRRVQLAQKVLHSQSLTMRQDEAGLKARPALGRAHGCKPEQIRLYPEDDCDPLLTLRIHPAEEAVRKRIAEEPYGTLGHVHWTSGDVPSQDDFFSYTGQDGSQTGWKDLQSEEPEATLARPVVAIGPSNLNFPIGTKGLATQTLAKEIDQEIAGLFRKAMKGSGRK